MPGENLIDLRRRVRSVKNIRQITRAMKFVAASKLRRAQDRIFAARPYANRMLAVLNSVATRVDPACHPLLAERDNQRVMLVVVTSDKGLCGAFNANIVRAAVRYIESDAANQQLTLALLGKKGVDWFAKRSWPIKHQYLNVSSSVSYSYAQEIASAIVDYYVKSELDSVQLVYNEFKSVIQQRLVIEPLLPIRRLEPKDREVFLDYIYEQPPGIIFDRLLPKHVETQIFRAMLESEAAEHGARMTAMDSATRNAEDMISSLTLRMNQMRQASITKELIEIVSGAEALAE
ncbi:MAG: ATP synthase F1 subunit gamma [Acidobacteria bacterium]|nr:MAG: ATP synthase F1 subunit gamma [Acidobacteriota bacterium]